MDMMYKDTWIYIKHTAGMVTTHAVFAWGREDHKSERPRHSLGDLDFLTVKEL